jgi:hypothetical protein
MVLDYVANKVQKEIANPSVQYALGKLYVSIGAVTFAEIPSGEEWFTYRQQLESHRLYVRYRGRAARVAIVICLAMPSADDSGFEMPRVGSSIKPIVWTDLRQSSCRMGKDLASV